MPFRRNYIRKGRKGRRITRRPWYRQKYTPLGLAKKALAGVWRLKGLVNSEKFKLDTSGFVSPTTSGLVNSLCAVAVGDSDNSRTGNSIFCRSLNGKIKIDRNTNVSAPNAQMVRISVIVDSQQVGDTAPSFTTIYENNNVISHLNNDTVGRFKVLYSKVLSVDSDDPQRYLEVNIPMRHHIRFNGTASSDIQKGGIYMVTTADDATYGPTLTYEWRLAYHDN